MRRRRRRFFCGEGCKRRRGSVLPTPPSVLVPRCVARLLVVPDVFRVARAGASTWLAVCACVSCACAWALTFAFACAFVRVRSVARVACAARGVLACLVVVAADCSCACLCPLYAFVHVQVEVTGGGNRWLPPWAVVLRREPPHPAMRADAAHLPRASCYLALGQPELHDAPTVAKHT